MLAQVMHLYVDLNKKLRYFSWQFTTISVLLFTGLISQLDDTPKDEVFRVVIGALYPQPS